MFNYLPIIPKESTLERVEIDDGNRSRSSGSWTNGTRFYKTFDENGIARVMPSVTVVTDGLDQNKEGVLAGWRKSIRNRLGHQAGNAYMRELSTRGTFLHEAVEKAIMHGDWSGPENKDYMPWWDRLHSHLPVHCHGDVLGVELRMHSKDFTLAGTADGVYRDPDYGVTLLDWKFPTIPPWKLEADPNTDKNPYPKSTYSSVVKNNKIAVKQNTKNRLTITKLSGYVLQMAAYAGMWNDHYGDTYGVCRYCRLISTSQHSVEDVIIDLNSTCPLKGYNYSWNYLLGKLIGEARYKNKKKITK